MGWGPTWMGGVGGQVVRGQGVGGKGGWVGGAWKRGAGMRGGAWEEWVAMHRLEGAESYRC